MIDILQRKRELLASIVLLSEQVKDLQNYKKRVEMSIVLLNRTANKKQKEITTLSDEIRELKQSIDKIRQDLDGYRRQEIENVTEEVTKIRDRGSI
ncbi:MAG TPA: hypothetical protein VJ327_00170 [Patescibacteria group bacterium]|nr:hypothetical protein [Patescibacteria group bacterium]